MSYTQTFYLVSEIVNGNTQYFVHNDIFKLVFGSQGKVVLKPLNARLRAVIYKAYINLEASLYLVDAFPDRSFLVKVSHLQEMLKHGANDAEEPEIHQRLCDDSDWARKLQSLVSCPVFFCALLILL